MKKKLVSILLGIKDGVLPDVERSVSKDESGKNHINTARLISAGLSWLMLIGALFGLFPWEKVIDILKLMFLAV